MDIELYYEEKGCGFPFIFLHGNGEDHSYFVNQIDFFSKEYRVIALDTRGHGKSPRGTAPFCISQFADDLYSFMLEHSIEKANILGFSDGGNIALCFALKHPQCVENLILNGANLEPSGVKRRFQLPIEIGYRIARFFSSKSEAAKKNSEMLGLMVNDPYIAPEKLKSLEIKTLVIAGTNDMIREDHSRFISQCIADSELSFIKGDHFIASQNPSAFNLRIKEFLNK